MNFLRGLRRICIVLAVPIVIGISAYWWQEGAKRPYPFDLAAAKAEGYQNEEIANFLASSYGQNMSEVRLQGVSDTAVIDYLLNTTYQATGKTYRQSGEQWLREIPPKKSTVPKQAWYAASAGAVSALVLAGLWMIFQWIFTGFFPSTKAAK